MQENGKGNPEDIPMTSDNEHLGLGEGWWYEGELLSLRGLLHP